MAFIRLGAALLGWFFGFFLGASLLEVTVVTPLTNPSWFDLNPPVR